MRTTLTVDDDLLNELRQRALKSGRPFRQVLQEVLRAGLQSGVAPAARPYRVPASNLGPPRLDLRRSLALADALEEEALAAKLQERR
jgi:hypothetical protein